jgi:DNA-binding CsgD family transcriptional regulator
MRRRVWADDGRGAAQRGQPLTARQMEVLMAVVTEHGNQQAADVLGISLQTVKNHMAQVLARGPYVNVTHAVWVLWPVLRARVKQAERRSGHDRRR